MSIATMRSDKSYIFKSWLRTRSQTSINNEKNNQIFVIIQGYFNIQS